jgi:hypothetical protein
MPAEPGLTRTLADISRLGEDDSPLRDEHMRSGLADVLAELAAAVLTFGRLARAHEPGSRAKVQAELQRHLDAARERQDRLSELLGTDPAQRPVGWPLRGEVIAHLDRLRLELQAGAGPAPPHRRRPRSWRRPLHPARPRPGSPGRRRARG